MTQRLALVALPLLLACGGDPSLPSAEPDDVVVSYALQAEIPAGGEVEYCKYVEAPADGLWVNRDEVRFSEGSHHFLLYDTDYDVPPSNEVFDCSDGATNGRSVTRLVAGSQNFSGDSVLNFPDDVALRVRPGAVMMMNAHYLNTTSSALDVEVKVDLHTIDEADVVHEGDVLFWYNIFIQVPAMAESTARMRCTVGEDVTFTSLQSHMHARGVGYEAAADGDVIYANDKWEDVPVLRFDDGLSLPRGTSVDYRCNYQNDEPRDVYQGPRSSDEMCMLIGSYYPTVPGLSFCSSDPADPMGTNSLGAEWVGNGIASCADTIGCVQEGFAIEDDEAFFNHLQSCVVGSDPNIASAMSDAVRCFLLNGSDAPTACSEELATCLAI